MNLITIGIAGIIIIGALYVFTKDDYPVEYNPWESVNQN